MADADGKNKKGCCEKLGDGFGNFCTFLYNKETGMVMGRSGKSWAKIGFFYLIFYGFLAGFFSGMLAIFLSTLNNPGEGGPKLTQYVKNQPGLNRLDKDPIKPITADSILNIKKEKLDKYKTDVQAFLDSYDRGNYKCNTSGVETGMGEKECDFDPKKHLGDCGSADKIQEGFDKNFTCIFVKINKVYDWVPKSTTGDTGYLELKCNNKGVEYFPKGYQIAAFPFRGQKKFELPVVAVKFNVDETKTFDCNLVGQDIVLSESVMPHRAFGRIRIKV